WKSKTVTDTVLHRVQESLEHFIGEPNNNRTRALIQNELEETLHRFQDEGLIEANLIREPYVSSDGRIVVSWVANVAGERGLVNSQVILGSENENLPLNNTE